MIVRKQIPEYEGTLRSHMIKIPACISECSGIRIFGRRIKSLAFTTDAAIIRNINADAIIAVYPFTPQPAITRAVMDVADMPVFRPLIGFDKREIVEISEKIDTYETSIQPFEDCCTIFVAKHPVTKPNVERIEKSELNLSESIEELMKTAIETAEVITVGK